MHVIGIDLGTSNNAVAFMNPLTGKEECIENKMGSYLTPSAICFQDEKVILIGEDAKNCKDIYPESTATLYKRLMGTEEVAITLKNGNTYSPQQLSALILKQLKGDAEEVIGETVKSTVITVPAYFDDLQRKATIEAGKLAGFEDITIIDEPMAALMTTGALDSCENTGKATVIIDLGGGTFDVLAALVTETSIEELCIAGDTSLGGADWTQAFADYITANNLKGEVLGVEEKQELMNKVELAKIALSKKDETKFSVMTSGGRKQVTVTKEDLHLCTAYLMEKVVKILKEMNDTLEDKGVEIGKIILCGGATRMVQFRKTVENLYPGIPIHEHAVDLAVAIGACIYANNIKNRPQINRGGLFRASAKPAKVLKHVSSRSFGIAAYVDDARKVCNMSLKNETLPISKKETYYTRYNGQDKVEISVYENLTSDRHEAIANSTFVGKCILEICGYLVKNSPIIVEMYIAEDGTLHIKGSEPSGGTEIKTTMKTNALLSANELEAARTQVEYVYAKVV